MGREIDPEVLHTLKEKSNIMLVPEDMGDPDDLDDPDNADDANDADDADDAADAGGQILRIVHDLMILVFCLAFSCFFNLFILFLA